jgi:Putative Ig domain
MIHCCAGFDRRIKVSVLAALLLTLSACGGGETGGASSAAASQSVAESAQSLSLTLSPQAQSQGDSTPQVLPSFHVAPVILEQPADTDAVDPAASAASGPHVQTVTTRLSQLSTRRLTQAAMDSVLQDGIVPDEFDGNQPGATPLSSGTVVATYTPAQIRAAYDLPELPAAGTTPSSVQSAQLGARQTIYIIDAQDDPNAAAELATFNQTFGLPICSVSTISPGAALPLPAAATTGCTFSVVHSTAAGGMTAAAPSYNSEWATEIALDVQWTHATAPLARIVLIEAPDSSTNSLLAAVSLANAMGPGVVSMSFGTPEGGWTASVDSTFTVVANTYVAAAGDSGAGVNWPAVSSHVLAVGGSSLTYTGTAPRSEIVWSDTGGGVSQYTPTPVYQTSAVPDMGTPAHRSVSDVTFNADPTTGQYIVVLAPGAASANWLSAGGTSLATPQWAGILAVANALRAQAEEAPIGDPHEKLYGIATQRIEYASAFYDITRGSDGSCADCFAEIGYDLPSGIGSPNVTSLFSELAAALAPSAPIVPAASVSGTAGSALSFTIAATAVDRLIYALSNAPSGMSINTAGAVSWAVPVAGTFAVTVSVKDTVTGLTGEGVYTVTIKPAEPPVVASATVTGSDGTALTYAVSVTDANPITFTLNDAPTGMTLSTAGILSWPAPATGTYSLTVTARDTKTGLTGQGKLSINIQPPKAPTVTAANVSATAGNALSFTVAVSAVDPVTWTLSGAPAGMAISSAGVIRWPDPLAGRYTITVSARDTKTNLTGSAPCTVTVTAAGPVITASTLSGIAGKPLAGTITLSDIASKSITINISGIPTGVTFTSSGNSLGVSWPSPVTGNYKLTVNAKDGAGLTASLNVPITIMAH